jgi:hypothetical protein
MTEQTYFTHFNGDRPYMVKVNGNHATVFMQDREYHDDDMKNAWQYSLIIMDGDCERIFIGKSPETKMTTFSGGRNSIFDGNTILLHVSENTYVHVGKKVMQFDTDDDTINEFYSAMGNANCPYPMDILKKVISTIWI